MMDMKVDISKFMDAIDQCISIKLTGKVTQVIGLVIESQGPLVSVGELCYVHSHFPGVPPIPAEVVGFRKATSCSCLWARCRESDPAAKWWRHRRC